MTNKEVVVHLGGEGQGYLLPFIKQGEAESGLFTTPIALTLPFTQEISGALSQNFSLALEDIPYPEFPNNSDERTPFSYMVMKFKNVDLINMALALYNPAFSDQHNPYAKISMQRRYREPRAIVPAPKGDFCFVFAKHAPFTKQRLQGVRDCHILNVPSLQDYPQLLLTLSMQPRETSKPAEISLSVENQ